MRRVVGRGADARPREVAEEGRSRAAGTASRRRPSRRRAARRPRRAAASTTTPSRRSTRRTPPCGRARRQRPVGRGPLRRSAGVCALQGAGRSDTQSAQPGGHPQRRPLVEELAHLLLLRRIQVVEEVGRGRDHFGAAGLDRRRSCRRPASSRAPGRAWRRRTARGTRPADRRRRAARRAGPAACRPAPRASASAPRRGRACCRRARPCVARNSAESPPCQPWRWPQPTRLPATSAAPANPNRERLNQGFMGVFLQIGMRTRWCGSRAAKSFRGGFVMFRFIAGATIPSSTAGALSRACGGFFMEREGSNEQVASKRTGGSPAVLIELLPAGRTVVDVGCFGWLLGAACARRQCVYIGVDRHEPPGRPAHARLRHDGGAPARSGRRCRRPGGGLACDRASARARGVRRRTGSHHAAAAGASSSRRRANSRRCRRPPTTRRITPSIRSGTTRRTCARTRPARSTG